MLRALRLNSNVVIIEYSYNKSIVIVVLTVILCKAMDFYIERSFATYKDLQCQIDRSLL